MLKFTAVVSILLVGSAFWAAGLSCDSCGSECASACGTRHFRSCCFNYLRKKRGPDTGLQFWPQQQAQSNAKDRITPTSPLQTPRVPLVVVENAPNIPESWLELLQKLAIDRALENQVIFNDS